MTRYALQPRYRRYVKGYGFMSFAKNLANRDWFLQWSEQLQIEVKT